MQLNAASACFVGTVNTLLSHDMRAKECKYSKTYTKKTVLGLLPCGDFQRYSAIVNFTSSVFFFFVRTIKSSAASKSVWRGDVINGLLQLIPMEMKVGIFFKDLAWTWMLQFSQFSGLFCWPGMLIRISIWVFSRKFKDRVWWQRWVCASFFCLSVVYDVSFLLKRKQILRLT